MGNLKHHENQKYTTQQSSLDKKLNNPERRYQPSRTPILGEIPRTDEARTPQKGHSTTYTAQQLITKRTITPNAIPESAEAVLI